MAPGWTSRSTRRCGWRGWVERRGCLRAFGLRVHGKGRALRTGSTANRLQSRSHPAPDGRFFSPSHGIIANGASRFSAEFQSGEPNGFSASPVKPCGSHRIFNFAEDNFCRDRDKSCPHGRKVGAWVITQFFSRPGQELKSPGMNRRRRIPSSRPALGQGGRRQAWRGRCANPREARWCGYRAMWLGRGTVGGRAVFMAGATGHFRACSVSAKFFPIFSSSA